MCDMSFSYRWILCDKVSAVRTWEFCTDTVSQSAETGMTNHSGQPSPTAEDTFMLRSSVRINASVWQLIHCQHYFILPGDPLLALALLPYSDGDWGMKLNEIIGDVRCWDIHKRWNTHEPLLLYFFILSQQQLCGKRQSSDGNVLNTNDSAHSPWILIIADHRLPMTCISRSLSTVDGFTRESIDFSSFRNLVSLFFSPAWGIASSACLRTVNAFAGGFESEVYI